MKLSKADKTSWLVVVIILSFIIIFMFFVKTDMKKKELVENSAKHKFLLAKPFFDIGDYDVAKAHLSGVALLHDSIYSDSIAWMNDFIDSANIAEQARLDSVVQVKQEQKKKALKEASTKLRKDKDEFNDITWYYDKSSPRYVNQNGFFAYIGMTEGSTPSLRMKIQYAADDWLFIQKYIIRVDNATFEITEDHYGEIESDNDEGIWEWIDRVAGSSEKHLLKSVAYGKNPKIRFEGRQYYKDKSITPQQQLALRNVLEAYEAFGGTL